MSSTSIQEWFGDQFHTLSPEIQQLHLHGGRLHGVVDVSVGKGIAGVLGRKLFKKLGVPGTGQHDLVVDISHQADGLHWDRLFDHSSQMKSTFVPVGNVQTGYWVENTGAIELRLTVDIKDGGWYWKVLSVRVRGLKVPLWLFPASVAYKRIENGKYRFFAGFYLPCLGELISYGGLLSLESQPVLTDSDNINQHV